MKYTYIATPITRIPDMNRPMVDKIAAWIRLHGDYPVIPHDIAARPHDGACPERDAYPGVTGQTHGGLCYLRNDLIVMLRRCDNVIMAPGWSRSRGAAVERMTALAVGMDVRYWHPDSGMAFSFSLKEDREGTR